jgi:hypothetical protein
MMLESSAAVKNKSVKEASFKLLSALVHKYQQMDVVSGAMIDLMNKHEHLPTTLAELAEFASQHHSDSRLVSPPTPPPPAPKGTITPASPYKVAREAGQSNIQCTPLSKRLGSVQHIDSLTESPPSDSHTKSIGRRTARRSLRGLRRLEEDRSERVTLYVIWRYCCARAFNFSVVASTFEYVSSEICTAGNPPYDWVAGSRNAAGDCIS